MSHHLFASVVFVLLGCSAVPTAEFQERCSFACVDSGIALTAGHCLDSTRSVAMVLEPSCEPVRIRPPRQGEPVTILSRLGTRQSVVLTAAGPSMWLEGVANPGESGAGVVGEDGALLGVVQSTSPGITIASSLWSLD